MPIFKYYGRNNQGQPVSGERFAQSDENLNFQLAKEGITTISIKMKSTKTLKKTKLRLISHTRVTISELQLFTRQMYTLTKAGVPIISAIKHLSINTNNVYFSEVLQGITEKLESGQKIATALEGYPDVFSDLIVGLVRVGENSGRLDTSFLHLSEYLELEGMTTKQFKSAIRYPILVMFAILVGIVIINIFIIPTFARVYANAGIPLPTVTKILISISNFFVNYWLYMSLVIGACVVIFYRYLKTAQGKLNYDRTIFKIPVIGRIIKRIVLQRFMQTFAIVFNAGIPIIEGLKLVSQTLVNSFARREVDDMRMAIERGSSIVQAAHYCKLFTPLEIQMLVVSEETGDLGTMLQEIAHYYQREVEYDLKRLTDLIEPILLIAVAIMVLLLALSVYMPIWSMVKLAHKG